MTDIFYVYILTTKNHKMFYTGFTNDIYLRVLQHKEKLFEKSFTSKFNINKLVYYEEYLDADAALRREWLIKRYKRDWKINLINGMNAEWRDLFEDFI